MEPLLKNLDLCVGKHIETLEKMEGDNDEEIELWEMQVELVHIKWQQCLELIKKRQLTFDGTSEAAVARERTALWLRRVGAHPRRV